LVSKLANCAVTVSAARCAAETCTLPTRVAVETPAGHTEATDGTVSGDW
jgi:hypothetical protein